VLWPRRPGIEYAVDHLRGAGPGELGEIVAVTNDGAPEFRVIRVPLADPAPARWTDVLASDPSTRWESVDVIGGYAVVAGRRDAEPFLHVVDLAQGGAGSAGRTGSGTGLDIRAEIPVGRILLERGEDPQATTVIVQIDSLVAPPRWLEVDLATGARTVIKTLAVPTYDPDSYVTERIWAAAPDGEQVPVTLARHIDTPLDGTAPCLLWGYGAYEDCIWPDWDPALVGAYDRGVVFAVAHVRGGGERGRRWWDEGHGRAKHHTFSDFVAAADALADGLVDGTRIASRGLSAGGLLQGAALTLAPSRWAAVIAEVPFVDVVTSMLDPSTPLTVTEWDEWGDPRDPDDFAAMLAYSPYDNPPAGPRPALLVTGSLHDPRVLVHEPAKWVARLRATAGPDDRGPLLFRVELGAGAHVGPAGRYGHLRYEAEVLAFALEAMDAASSRDTRGA
jgi:oligopeptidase B